MEKDKFNYQQARNEIDDLSIQQTPTMDDILLNMLSTEMKIKMIIEQLKQEIEESLETFDKEKFLESTTRLKKYEHFYEK